LAVTDANLVLRRLIPDFFPHIFGETEDQPLDLSASQSAFKQLTSEVRDIIPQKKGHPRRTTKNINNVKF